MRRKIVTLMLMAVALTAMAGDNHIAATDLTWGTDTLLTITLDNDDAVNGFQFDLLLPEGFAVATDGNTPQAVPTQRLRNHNIVFRRLGDGRYRLLVFSLGGKAILGHHGKAIIIPLRMTGEMPKGVYQLKLTEISFSFEGQQVKKSLEQPDVEARLTVE